MRSAAALLALALLAAAPVRAQMPGAVAPGARIRVWLTPLPRKVEGSAVPQQLRGSLVSLTADSITVRIHPQSAPVTLARRGVWRIDVSHGVPSRVESAARAGLGGAVVGAFYAPIIDYDRRYFRNTGEAAWKGAAYGAAYGAALGAIFPRERWRRVRRPAQLTVGAPPAGKGVTVGIRIGM
ncbi:MAG TPA: hypothetical protein VFE05_02155 [Longimicrobiaceae bacterium]|jgi:hypothetical protein|nr:hypothetical protein [Longimicrobiaceae bacterium]